MKSHNLTIGLAILVGLILAVANTASALTVSMNGEWYQNRGPLVDIPANGGAVFCSGPVSSGCVSGLRPLNGGIPARSVVVNVTGVSPANFVVPGSVTNATAMNPAFSLPGGAANRQTVPVAGIPTVIQLASQFSLAGPANIATGGTAGDPAGGVASFQANAWSNDPVQAARAGANFTWCPPDGNCSTTTYSRTYGVYRARMKYTAGTNAFGGTMAMMLRDTGVVSINIGGTPARVLHQLVGGTVNPTFAPQMGGAGYAAARQLTLAPGPIYASYMTSTPCTSGFGQAPSPPGCGVITTQGNFLFNNPSSINSDWGMPWTTGTVIAQNLPGPVPTQDPATFFSVAGTDSRNGIGFGQVTMVAGATTERKPSGNHFTALEVVTMRFDGTPTPLLSPTAIAATLALMLLAGGYMARRNFASQGA